MSTVDKLDRLEAVTDLVRALDLAVLGAGNGAGGEAGLRGGVDGERSNEDKRRSVETLLRDEEWSQWSDRKIAEQCKVGHPLVARVRAEVTGTNSSEPRRYVTKHGTEAVMNTASIGKPKAEPATSTKAPAAPAAPRLRVLRLVQRLPLGDLVRTVEVRLAELGQGLEVERKGEVRP